MRYSTCGESMAIKNPGKDAWLSVEPHRFRLNDTEMSLKEARKYLKVVLGSDEAANQYITLLLLDEGSVRYGDTESR